MATKELKTLKFPGLTDTYEVASKSAVTSLENRVSTAESSINTIGTKVNNGIDAANFYSDRIAMQKGGNYPLICWSASELTTVPANGFKDVVITLPSLYSSSVGDNYKAFISITANDNTAIFGAPLLREKTANSVTARMYNLSDHDAVAFCAVLTVGVNTNS